EEEHVHASDDGIDVDGLEEVPGDKVDASIGGCNGACHRSIRNKVSSGSDGKVSDGQHTKELGGEDARGLDGGLGGCGRVEDLGDKITDRSPFLLTVGHGPPRGVFSVTASKTGAIRCHLLLLFFSKNQKKRYNSFIFLKKRRK